MENFSAHLQDEPGASGERVLRIRGSIDTASSIELDAAIRAVLDGGDTRVVLDFEAVDYVSSAGWGVMLSCVRQLRDSGGDLYLMNMCDDVRDVFELLEFQSVLSSIESLDELSASTS